MSVTEKYNNHIMPSYGRYELILEKGAGRAAVDENGRKYIDFGSGIGTNSLGYCDEEWADAVCAQVRSLQHTSNYYYNKVQADFAEKLCKKTGYTKVFFGNSGAEANECAIKLARKYSFDKYGAEAKRYNIVTLKNSFHGRTLTTLSATGQDDMHNYFFPFTQGFRHAEVNDINDLKAKLDDTVCAVMFEFIQGEGGVNCLTRDFADALFALCVDRDILTIADEVQTGTGRTGGFLASEWYDLKPDIVTLAKGLAGGLPFGVCMAWDKCADVFTAGTHGSTFGGNPVVCAGANAVLDRLTPEFLNEVRKKGDYIGAELLKIPEVEDVSGLGLMFGITLKTKKAADVCKAALENGLLALTAKEKLRLLPPLNITYDEIDEGLLILKRVLE
ncbi:MAG: aspartate aminotransferase family protein [Oscillospiraceae bacterium]|nr:aspartate aminotransferase family protein [Oscillospiraceae bacterium]